MIHPSGRGNNPLEQLDKAGDDLKKVLDRYLNARNAHMASSYIDELAHDVTMATYNWQRAAYSHESDVLEAQMGHGQ